MSTLSSQARISPNWKEEVNQRLAAHKNRKPVPVAEQDTAAPEQHASNNRAAAAAARVAARFAKAPRYSELLESEARAAVRAAEAVSRAALQAQAAAESVLAELEAAKATEPEWQFDDDEDVVTAPYRRPAVEEVAAGPSQAIQSEYEPAARNELADPIGRDQSFDIHWEPDVPRLRPETEVPNSHFETEEWRQSEQFAEESVEIVEPFQPIHANLIEFPREIVAPRKARPRRAEGPFAAQHEHDVQLSIFEVDPDAISTDPVSPDSMNPESAPTWMSAEWSGMELDEHPAYSPNPAVEQEYVEEPVEYVIKEKAIYQAPLSLRAMAVIVDGSLVLAALSAVMYEIVSHAHSLPGIKVAEIIAALGFVIVSALYLALFSAMGQVTPGMRYARIALSTFDGEMPTPRMRLNRLAALVLSVLPVGVGILWSIFDEDHLSWHDRLSGTYLRTY